MELRLDALLRDGGNESPGPHLPLAGRFGMTRCADLRRRDRFVAADGWQRVRG